MVRSMIVALGEPLDLGLTIEGQEVVFQQDAVHEGGLTDILNQGR